MHVPLAPGELTFRNVSDRRVIAAERLTPQSISRIVKKAMHDLVRSRGKTQATAKEPVRLAALRAQGGSYQRSAREPCQKEGMKRVLAPTREPLHVGGSFFCSADFVALCGGSAAKETRDNDHNCGADC